MRLRSLVGTAAVAALTPGALAWTPQCPGVDDPFEDNDDCASAIALPAGLTPGLYTETRAGDHDYFTFQVPGREVATIELFFEHAAGDVNVIVHGAGCGSILGLGFSVTDGETVEVVNGGNAPLDLVIEVFVNSVTPSDCNTYDLRLTSQPDPCAAVSDDVFEPNDDCVEATALAPGVHAGLVVFAMDLDFYRIVVPPGDELRVDCDHVHAAGDVNLFLYDPSVACGGGLLGSPVAQSITPTDDESVQWINASAAPVEVVLEVGLSPIVASGCNDYALDVTVLADECAGMDDGLEDNDDCATALPLAFGQYDDLFVGADDPDFYSTVVAAGDVLGAHCSYAWADGPLALLLWDPGVACGTGPFTGELARSITPVDGERLFWTNDTGADVTIVVEVRVAALALGRCNRYDLRLETFPDECPGGLGEVFCRGVVNSTGVGSSLCAEGSDVAAANDVVLTVKDLPLDAVGYFVVSRNPVVTLVSPAGSAGQLCVASPAIGRQAPVLDSGPDGAVELRIDLTTTPQPTVPVAIGPGETWCWQLWHRDVAPSGATTSNFSSARRITFR